MNQSNDQTEDIRALLRDKYDNTEPSTEAGKAAFAADVERLASGEPLAFVIGWVPFLGIKIQVTHEGNNTLIPRPETEWWTEKLITHLQEEFGDEPFELLDLCAGSGAIGLAVLQALPNAFVSFGEIDPVLTKLIEKNLQENKLDGDRASIHAGDLFSPFEDEQFDLIVSNPPYIPNTRTLDSSVSEYEPTQALFSGTDGLDLIRTIIADAPMYLVPHGELWIECDTSNIEEAQKIADRAGYTDTAIHDDQYGRARLLVGHFE